MILNERETRHEQVLRIAQQIYNPKNPVVTLSL